MPRPPIDKSIAGYEQVLKKAPDCADIYYRMGLAYDKSDQKDNAKKNYQKAITLDPNHNWALFWYGELLILLKKYHKADIIISKREKVYPKSMGESALRAYLLAAKGERNKAFEINLENFDKLRIYQILKMKEELIRYLDRDFERIRQSKRSWYLQFTYYPLYEFLRSDPRFQEILAKHKEIYEENLEKYGDIDI